MPSFQPMVPGTTVAWTAHTNSSVPAFASGEIVVILCYYYCEVFDYRYVGACADMAIAVVVRSECREKILAFLLPHLFVTVYVSYVPCP